MTVKINQNAGSAPRPLAQALVEGQVLPFWASLTHKNKKPLVVPSSGINTPIEPNVKVQVKVKSFDQAWLLVTDLAELARHAGNEAEDFAVLTPAEVPAVEALAPALEETTVPAVAPVPAAGKAAKPAAKEAI